MEEMSFMSDWADDEREATKNGIVGFYFTNDSMLCRVYEVTDNCETELINLLEDFEKYQKRLPTRIYLPNEVIDKLDLIEAVEKNIKLGNYDVLLRRGKSDVEISCDNNSSKTISDREYRDLKYKESMYDELLEIIDIEVPKLVTDIVEEELKKFNELKTNKKDSVSWAELISYRFHCQGYNPDDDNYLYEVGYFDFEKICKDRISKLSVFDRYAIDTYNQKEDSYRENKAFEESFYVLVEPLYHNLSDEKKESIEGIFDSYEED